MSVSGSAGFHRRRVLVPVLVVLSVASLVAGLLVAAGVIGAGWGAAPASDPGRPVAVHQVRGRAVRIPAMPAWHRPPVSWPAAGPGTAVFTARAAAVPAGRAAVMTAGPTAGSARAGSLPVWAGPPAGSGPVIAARPAGAGMRAAAHGRPGRAAVAVSRTLAQAPLASGAPVARVAMSMAPQSAAAALGVRGVVFTVARADGQAAAGRVHVSLDYGSFAAAYGGGYASRLHLVELPACALATPGAAACRKQVPLVSADNTRAAQLGADVIVPGTPAAAVTPAGPGAPVVTAARLTRSPAPLVLAATTASQGPGGDFGAEPLSEQDQWVTGGSSGAYTYSYKIGVPPVPGGLEPSVSLDYDSQMADGLNASTNNEASSIGDGWTYEPGFIEADYPTCAETVTEIDTLDLCAGTQELTMTMNGTTTPLVVSDTTGTTGTHPEADQSQQVNQTANGGYEVIEPDGTQYWFGLNQLPGYVAGDQATSSIWTVPVWNRTGFVTRTWRWMLDYVVDPRGNAIAYFYSTQANWYAENNGTTGTGSYTQGGMLARIEYGLHLLPDPRRGRHLHPVHDGPLGRACRPGLRPQRGVRGDRPDVLDVVRAGVCFRPGPGRRFAAGGRFLGAEPDLPGYRGFHDVAVAVAGIGHPHRAGRHHAGDAAAGVVLRYADAEPGCRVTGRRAGRPADHP